MLCEKFPYLHRLFLSRNISIFFNVAFSPLTMNWNWQFDFKRSLNDREVEELATVMSSIENIIIDELEED